MVVFPTNTHRGLQSLSLFALRRVPVYRKNDQTKASDGAGFGCFDPFVYYLK